MKRPILVTIIKLYVGKSLHSSYYYVR